jgi:hypothetical protein
LIGLLIGLPNSGTPWLNLLSALANLSFIIYIPIVIFELRQASRAGLREQEREAEARKNEIYAQLIQGYIDWQKLCLQYVDLDIADYADETPRSLTPLEAKQEQLALGILIELFEQAFLAFLDAPPVLRANQWRGWEIYIEDYCQRDNFRRVWKVSRPSMDLRFSEFMEQKIQDATPVKLP